MDLLQAQTVMRRKNRAATVALTLGAIVHEYLSNITGTTRALIGTAAQAGVMNDLWFERCLIALSSDAGIRGMKDNGQRCIVVDDELLFRFKKLGAKNLPNNYPTTHAVQWNEQIAIKGLPPLPRLDFCYRLDVTGSTVLNACLMLRRGNLAEWTWQVGGIPNSTFVGHLNGNGVYLDMFGRAVYAYGP